MKHIIYTKEILEAAVKKSVSVAGVIRELGLRPAGGTQSHLNRKIKSYGIDTGHFTGRATNCGSNHKGPKKKTWQEILVKRLSGNRTESYLLRRALIESGVPYQCARCPLEGVWNGKPIMLQVNHLNRDWLDDRKSNLEFICPNCHSQTEGWCGSKGCAEITSTGLQKRERRRRRQLC